MYHTAVTYMWGLNTLTHMSTNSNNQLKSGLNSEVVQRAKAAGINVSLLLAVKYEPIRGNSRSDLVTTYEKLFNAMKDIMCDYETVVEVGLVEGVEKNWPLMWSQSGQYMNGYEGPETTSIHEDVYFLYDPIKILYNLLSAITERTGSYKKSINEVQVALLSVKDMFNDVEKDGG